MLMPEKLRQNALTSIRLGIEDFQRSSIRAEDGGDPDRAISSARNLFSGLLLLFKYRLILSIEDPLLAEQVIYKAPREIIPHPNGQGGVEWKPVGKFSNKLTIDVEEIKSRFSAFKIDINWELMKRLQIERNNLEHLHPTESTGAIAGFVADLFPLLGSFITEELEEVPATLLGTTWSIMLAHHSFFIEEQKVSTAI